MATTALRRSSRTRLERIPIINSSADDLSEYESNTDIDSLPSAEGSIPKNRPAPRKRARISVTPVAKRSTSTRKKTPLRNGSHHLINDTSMATTTHLANEDSGDQIRFAEILLDLTKKKADIKQSVEDWNQLYERNNDVAIASIMSFVLHLCGCSQWFPPDRINDDLNDPSFIKPFQASIENSTSTDGLLSPNKATSKRIESRLKTWSVSWIAHMSPSILFESDILSRIIDWAATLSQNSIRSIRLVSCIFIFSVLSALIPCYQKLQNQLMLIEKSLQQKSKRPAKALAQITEDRVEFQSNLGSIDQSISAVFQEIFVPRYRDIYAAVRERCLESLRDWILASDSFASDTYFKYLGWALNSSYASVRLLAIRSINDFVKSDSVRRKMSSFLNRFVQRIIEMHHDVDETVGAIAIDTCTTMLIHDDVLTNFESFGDVAPFLWDRSRLIREAAANYVFEDSFNSEEFESPSNLSLQADIDQLFTIYSEAAPSALSFPVIISTLVELFFFKLPCIRNREALVDRLKSSADSRAIQSNGPYSLSHFVAQLMLGCCNYAILNKELHSRMSKNQRSIVVNVFESYSKFIADSDFLSLMQQFQAEREVFCCLAELMSAVIKNRKNADQASPCEVCPDLGSAVLSFLNRETNRVHLASAAAALASLSDHDSQLEREIQQTVSECVDSIQAFAISDYISQESGLVALAALSRVCSISQQVFCPILQETQFLDDILVDLSRSVCDIDNVEMVSAIIESIVKISHSVILWGLSRHLDLRAVQAKVSRLLTTLKEFFSGSERLSVLAACITADISVVALNNPQIRVCLSDDIFHLLRDFIAQHITCLEIVKAGARLVCSFCPEHVSICATLLAASSGGDFDEHMLQIIKAAVGFLRLHDGRALASAILEALVILFREKGLKDALSFSRRMAVSYGVSRTSASHFDIVVIGGIDKFLDTDVDASFLNALQPFVNRGSPAMLQSIGDHVRAVRSSLRDDALLSELDEFHQHVLKKLPTSSTTSARAQDNGEDGLKSMCSGEVREDRFDIEPRSDSDNHHSSSIPQSPNK